MQSTAIIKLSGHIATDTRIASIECASNAHHFTLKFAATYYSQLARKRPHTTQTQLKSVRE